MVDVFDTDKLIEGSDEIQVEPIGTGSFADAWDESYERGYKFLWMLTGSDEHGSFTKPIWHIGEGKFIDSIGAEINGDKHALTIECIEECDLVMSSKIRRHLTVGENVVPFVELGYDPNGTKSAGYFKIVNTGTDSLNKTAITGVDFANMIITVYEDSTRISGYTNLEYIKRLRFVKGPYESKLNLVFSNNNKCRSMQIATYGEIEYASTSGVQNFIHGDFNSDLEVLDLRGLNIVTPNATLYISGNNVNQNLKELDIRDLDTDRTKQVILCTGKELRKLVIGNFTNKNFTQKTGLNSGRKTDKILICTTSEPPALKNCSFDEHGQPENNYSDEYDWIAGHFAAIYVPSESVITYQQNVYVEDGTIGLTGWSVYADIIHDVAEYTDYTESEELEEQEEQEENE